MSSRIVLGVTLVSLMIFAFLARDSIFNYAVPPSSQSQDEETQKIAVSGVLGIKVNDVVKDMWGIDLEKKWKEMWNNLCFEQCKTLHNHINNGYPIGNAVRPWPNENSRRKDCWQVDCNCEADGVYHEGGVITIYNPTGCDWW